MDVWGSYQRRIEAKGGSQRAAILQREKRMLREKSQHSLAYHNVTIDDIERVVDIIDTDNLNIKFIHSLPGEDIDCGGVVEWMGYHWLITERDANNEIKTKAKMQQCNYLLKWVNDNHEICQQWCIVEDGTKYLTGEYEDRNFIITRGDSRMAMILPKTNETIKFNRDFRFLIDDPDSKEQLAYALTKPLKVGQVYNGKGVFGFVLQEVQTTDNDNLELGIADYYKHFDRKDNTVIIPETDLDKETTADTGKKVWF